MFDAPESYSFSRDERASSAMELSSKKQTSSAGRLWGKSIIYGKEDDHATPYMTRYWIGRLRLHIFHRGDQDPDCHDHPWPFWTFPLTPYVEEVAVKRLIPEHCWRDEANMRNVWEEERESFDLHRQIVPAWRLTFRPATHTHRVLGRYSGDVTRRHDSEVLRGVPVDYVNSTSGIEPHFDNGRIITFVWRGKDERPWGFLKNRDGKWCWVTWKEYVFGGGKSAPCE